MSHSYCQCMSVLPICFPHILGNQLIQCRLDGYLALGLNDLANRHHFPLQNIYNLNIIYNLNRHTPTIKLCGDVLHMRHLAYDKVGNLWKAAQELKLQGCHTVQAATMQCHV